MRLYLPLILATSPLLADRSDLLYVLDERLTTLEEKVERAPIYSSSGRAETAHALNLFLVAEYLYLQPQESGLAFGIKTNDPTFSSPQEHFNYKNLDFDYNSGYRGVIGYNIPHDAWDLYFYWMHYNTDVHGHARAEPGGGILPLWSALQPVGVNPPFFALNALARLRLNLNIGDIELGREYYIGKSVTLRPSLAVRAGFINQHYHVVYKDLLFNSLLITDDIWLKNDFWGVGPKAGIDSQWNLFGGFHVYGSAAFSLLYGTFTIARHETYPEIPGQPDVISRDSFQLVRAIFDFNAGLGWDIMLMRDQYHLALRGGYEQHLYFGQNQLEQMIYNNLNANFLSNLGDLSLAGWTLSLRLDF